MYRSYALLLLQLVGCLKSEAVVCGFGVCPAGSVCDDVHQLCTLCGNASVEEGEECDDGNPASNDGCSSSCSVESLSWTRWTPSIPWKPRTNHGAAYDPAGEKLIVIGGVSNIDVGVNGETWERQGPRWSRVMEGPAKYGASVVFDEARGRVVLFGGGYAPDFSDVTYQYKNGTWSVVTVGVHPPPRRDAAIAYDPVLQKVVLFGGISDTQYFADTWTLDGNGWAQVATTTSPSARANAVAAWDANRSRVVLFGGTDANQAVKDDTWELAGANWIQLAPAVSPPSRLNAAMVFSPELGGGTRPRLVLFGGRNNTDVFNDTWEFDGTTWAPRAVPTSPPAREGHTLTRVPPVTGNAAQLVLVGGTHDDLLIYDDVWEYDGNTWARRNPSFSPDAILGASVYDAARDRLVVLGGTSASDLARRWDFDGVEWNEQMVPSSAPRRNQYMMAYDTKRSRLVVFGGYDGANNVLLGDTWEWDGTSWKQFAGAGPSPRYGGGMAYHEADGVSVLVGGCVGGTNCQGGFESDTWTFDGTQWTMVSSTSGVGKAYLPPMTYDSERGTLVLYGAEARDASTFWGNETWEYDDGAWTQVATTGAPPGSYYAGLVYHQPRKRLLLRSDVAPGLWELVDGAWTPLEVPGEGPRSFGVQTMLHGALVMIAALETWTLRWGRPEP